MDKKYQLRWIGLDGNKRAKTCDTLAEAQALRTVVGRDWAQFTDETPEFSIWEIAAVQLEGV